MFLLQMFRGCISFMSVVQLIDRSADRWVVAAYWLIAGDQCDRPSCYNWVLFSSLLMFFTLKRSAAMDVPRAQTSAFHSISYCSRLFTTLEQKQEKKKKITIIQLWLFADFCLKTATHKLEVTWKTTEETTVKRTLKGNWIKSPKRLKPKKTGSYKRKRPDWTEGVWRCWSDSSVFLPLCSWSLKSDCQHL